MNKYEKLIEYIINGNEQAAKQLFHKIVVEKSRDIYESIEDEDLGGNPAASFVDDISSENDMEDEVLDSDTEDEFGDDEDELGDDEFGDDESDEDLEDRVLDLEAELDELKAEFDRLMSDEEGDDLDSDMDDMEGDLDSEDDMDDEFDGDEDFGDEDEGDFGSEDEVEDEFGVEDEQKVAENRAKSESEIMKEYVDKVKDFYKGEQGEGNEIGTGGSVNVNKKSVTDNMKNDMGGTTANIAKGGNESTPDGQRPNGKAGGFLKSPQEHDEGKRNVNKPGGNKGAQKFYNKKAHASKPEGSTTGDKVTVQKDSILKARK